ncbi:MAG TPA: ABC transporter ATP-binding protein, partial [Nitrospirota bacterium]
MMVRTENLSKVFVTGFRRKKVTALKGLTMEVRQGDVFGFLGPNGAGKTTTLKILMGLIYPTTGKAWIMGQELGSVEVKRRIGFLPEQPYFYDYLTATEFLDFYGRLFGMPKAERRNRGEELLDMVGLSHASGMQLRT